MFPKSHRIKSEEFAEIMKKGKVYHTPLFSLCNMAQNKAIFAVVASKKVSKKAVIRNKNKRRVRHALKKVVPSSFRGACIIFIKKDLSATEFPVISEDLKALVSKLG